MPLPQPQTVAFGAYGIASILAPLGVMLFEEVYCLIYSLTIGRKK